MDMANILIAPIISNHTMARSIIGSRSREYVLNGVFTVKNLQIHTDHNPGGRFYYLRK
jgi:hypothetical protein